MSQPHPPRPEDQPAQQPSDPQEPRTQEIPLITPDAEAPTTAPPGPAFSTDASYHPGTPPAAGPAPAAAPPPPVSPQQMPPPSFPPQPVPPEQVWPQPGTPAPSGDAAWPPQPTGPVDLVPGFGAPAPRQAPAAGSTAAAATGQLPTAGRGAPPGTAPQPSAGSGRSQAAKRLGLRLTGGLHATSARDAPVVLGLGLGVVGVVLLELGLAQDFGNESLWSVLPTWSVFATVAALVAVVPLVLRWVPGGLAAGTGWRIGAAGVAGLAAFWVLVALPLVASDRGFLLTAALALAAGALWLAPGRAPAHTHTGTTGRSG